MPLSNEGFAGSARGFSTPAWEEEAGWIISRDSKGTDADLTIRRDHGRRMEWPLLVIWMIWLHVVEHTSGLEDLSINTNSHYVSSLRSIDIRFLDEIFEMEGGYVLDFSDRTMRDFFADELDVDIDDRAYLAEGSSKAKRLRFFLKAVDDRSASKCLKALWQHRLYIRERRGSSSDGPNIQGRFLQLIAKLEGQIETRTQGSDPVPATGVQKFEAFKERLLALALLEPQSRGYAFEKFLRDLFNANGLAARDPFRLRGEQIDGSFVMGGQTYLIEAKWHGARCGVAPLHVFHGKLDEKADWARGVFISYSGFTDEGLYAFGRAKKRLICVDGLDLHESLRREIPLVHVLEEKVRKAAETGEVFVKVDDLFR